MMDFSLLSLAVYSQRITTLLDRPTVQHSTLTVWSNSPYTGVAEGEVVFNAGFRLRMHEEVDFAEGRIMSYGYEVYHRAERLYWYDDFPHPNDPTLAVSFPHHKHIPPDMKYHRIPAPEISYARCNLPLLIQEIEALITSNPESTQS